MSSFAMKTDAEGHLLSLCHVDDPYAMNWVEGATPWGTVTVPKWPEEYAGWGVPEKPYQLTTSVRRELTPKGRLRETYCFSNESDYIICTQPGDVGICTCFNDSYETAENCQKRRCTAHVWCGGDTAWVMALRMGGEAPHLGLVLTEGAIESYCIERDAARGSNDRGDIILHPGAMCLKPGETCRVSWELFWFDSRPSFFEALRRTPGYIEVTADRWVAYAGERVNLLSSGSPAQVCIEAKAPGVQRQFFSRDRKTTHADILVLPPFERLVESRVRFIVQRQQSTDESSPLYGAFLIYDNETGRQYYSHVHDHNAARERVGMGVLLARWLRTHSDEEVRASLDKYIEYVRRELFDRQTGRVYNDYGRSDDWHRLYNYSWVIDLFLETYQLTGEPEYLKDAARAYIYFCDHGGDEFYAIGLDECRLCRELDDSGMNALADAARTGFKRHAQTLLELDVGYKPLEVNYEQSIVQPAMETMLSAYEYFGEAKYLEAARRHLRLLELFSGSQPDYHMYEVAMRHWDGFWFGKRRLLGDTLPHYWSALTGHAYARYAHLTGEKAWRVRAEHALRAPLSLFAPDGSAACAYIFPMSVNHRPAHCADPWANDQDWAMYFALKWRDGLEGTATGKA